MHENDDLPQDSVADEVENDDDSNGQEENDPDQVRLSKFTNPRVFVLFLGVFVVCFVC